MPLNLHSTSPLNTKMCQEIAYCDAVESAPCLETLRRLTYFSRDLTIFLQEYPQRRPVRLCIGYDPSLLTPLRLF